MKYGDDRDNLLDGPSVHDKGSPYLSGDELAVATGRQCGKCNKPMNPVDAMAGTGSDGRPTPVCGPCASAGAQHAMSAAARAQKTWGM